MPVLCFCTYHEPDHDVIEIESSDEDSIIQIDSDGSKELPDESSEESDHTAAGEESQDESDDELAWKRRFRPYLWMLWSSLCIERNTTTNHSQLLGDYSNIARLQRNEGFIKQVLVYSLWLQTSVDSKKGPRIIQDKQHISTESTQRELEKEDSEESLQEEKIDRKKC